MRPPRFVERFGRLYYCKRGLHTKTYAIPNFTLLTVAPTPRRMANLIEVHQKHTKGMVHPNSDPVPKTTAVRRTAANENMR